jgi:phosphoglycolate phosphatase-like HAD superfamily hydrolase
VRLDRPTVFLFDIDGTLLLTGGAGRRAFERAFEVVTGRPDAVSSFSFAGMTDRAIARIGLAALGRAADEATISQLLDTYLQALSAELREPRGYRVLPGVREIVGHLLGHANAAVGLGTGNLRRGAQAKLHHADLWRLFGFGGFGCDHEERCELLRAGALRGAEQLGLPLRACRTVVIGDTVRDVRAAQELGAECLAVCTGGGHQEELRAAGASDVFADLTQPGVAEWLCGRRG